MSKPPIKFIRHQHMNLPESPLFATYPMVEYYHYSDAIDEVTRLKAEVERLTAENRILEGRVRYWKIEAECEHGRWIRTLEDLEHLRNLK